jgi:cell wall-associated NlpC family hydrolase
MRCAAVLLVLCFLAPALPAEEPTPSTSEGVVERALSWIGVKYRFGSSDERRGFDCSGLVRRAFSTVGIELPASAAAQYRVGEKVPLAELSPGDLVFFRNTYKPGISHVGIYLGENRFVHAASRRQRVVVDALDAPYYRTRFAGGRRVTDEPRVKLTEEMQRVIEQLPFGLLY